ncbi:MmcQ/YjbR family DNA-binding protein [Caviibacterium pharyngocola]|uniref:MmcQ family protein n=1 Tax=Caviibacterium pharyngocola TaxID=28159 RepID=A0A2M8RVG1_9PAST|nr:MmcQ/YjbR family DNA-binding protein [Caviibacterium pharyngocola]PJG82865.1 MmcQ family protein [Caviibacterium pharyngocola]
MITRQHIFDYVLNQYGIEPSYPFPKFPDVVALRHQNKKNKAFAFILQVSAEKLGLNGDETVEIINLKCKTEVISSLRNDPDILPGYHMNKEHWFSLRLDSNFPEDQVYKMIDWSYDLTVK